jgi:hypothetical protein
MKNISIASTCLVLFFATSCHKKEVIPSPVPDEKENGVALKNFYSQNLNELKQTFTVNASIGGVVTGSKGTKITIYPNSLTSLSGQLISGNVTVELVEIYDRASMIMTNKPTMGRLGNGDIAPLVSAGEYFLQITQEGQILDVNYGVFVQVPSTNPDFAMTLFDGEINEAGDLLWLGIEDSIAIGEDSAGGQWSNSYQFFDNSWGWTNVDRFYSDPRPKTTIKVKLPDGFDNTNSEVYITYDGEETALASLDVFTTDGYFSEHYGLIPIGLEIHVVAVTMIEGVLNYAILPQIVEENEIMTVNSFTAITEADFVNLINNLP